MEDSRVHSEWAEIRGQEIAVAVREARKVRICPPQSSVLNPSQSPSPWHYHGPSPLAYETLGVHQKMTLTSFDLLAAVVAPILSAHCSTLHRLGIHNASAGLWISRQANSQTLPDSPVDALPGTVDAPLSEIVVNGGPSRKVVRKQAPLLAATLQDVKDGV
jgi:hypothetical protein